jgi:hypothetical protein
MSPKIHPEIHPIGKPGQPSKPIPVERPSVNPNITREPAKSPAGGPRPADNPRPAYVPNPKDPRNYPSPG